MTSGGGASVGEERFTDPHFVKNAVIFMESMEDFIGALKKLSKESECLGLKQGEDWEQSIFIKRKEGGYKLRENIQFHMYMSSSPCGDARINSPYEITANLHSNKHIVKKFHSHLRTKIESGEGTLPVRSRSLFQTWDGVLQGEQLITMSCTDKIARYEEVGEVMAKVEVMRTVPVGMHHTATMLAAAES
ncbi:RED2 editase, partial [Polypterus senegalus]